MNTLQFQVQVVSCRARGIADGMLRSALTAHRDRIANDGVTLVRALVPAAQLAAVNRVLRAHAAKVMAAAAGREGPPTHP